ATSAAACERTLWFRRPTSDSYSCRAGASFLCSSGSRVTLQVFAYLIDDCLGRANGRYQDSPASGLGTGNRFLHSPTPGNSDKRKDGTHLPVAEYCGLACSLLLEYCYVGRF